jgi:uncharacterized protein YsxB (DUF464 family)
MTTVTFTKDTFTAWNHAGNTTVCCAVSVSCQLALRILGEAGLLIEFDMQRKPAMIYVKHGDPDDPLVVAVRKALADALREIAQANPNALEVNERAS